MFVFSLQSYDFTMMADSMDDPDIEQSPDFRQALKLVLKQEIHFLLRRLSETGEESLVITASLGDGEVTQLGSGKGNEYFQFKKLEALKKDFLLFCRDPDSGAFQKKEEKVEIVEQDKQDVMETSIPTELPLQMGVVDDTVIKVELNPDCIELERVQISSLVPTDQTATMETVDEISTDHALHYAAASLNSVVTKEGALKKSADDRQQVEPFSLLNSFSLQPLEQKDMTHQGHRSDETQVAAGIHVAMETWNEPSQGKKNMIHNLVTPHTKSDVTFVHSLQIKQEKEEEEEEFLCETEGICDNNKIVLDFSDMDILPSGSGLDKCGGPQQLSQDRTNPEHDHMFMTGSFQSGNILDTQRIPESQETVTSHCSKSQTIDKDQTLWSDYIGGSHHLSATARNNNLTCEPFLETNVKGQSWKGKKAGVEKVRSQSSSSNPKRIFNEEEACVSEMVTERPQPRLELQGQRSTGSLVSKLSEKPANMPLSRGVSFSFNRSPETHSNRHLQASHSLTETISRDLEATKTQSGKGVKNSLDMIDLTDEAELQESSQSDSLLRMKNPVSIPTAENVRRYTEKVKTPNSLQTDFNVTAVASSPPQYQGQSSSISRGQSSSISRGQSSSISSLHTARGSSTHTEHKRPNKLNTSNNLSNMFVMVGKKAKCLICNTHLISVDYMKTHLRNHIGYKPYKCNYCGRSFADNSNLRRHIQTHTGERPYACNNCNKTFLRNTHLRKHLLQCVSRTAGDLDST